MVNCKNFIESAVGLKILDRINVKILTVILVGLLLSSGGAFAGDFTDNHNGTVTDNITSLMWQENGYQHGLTWEQAISCCEYLDLGSREDWRLPNIKELNSLTDRSRLNPAIDLVSFPDTAFYLYFSSTTVMSDTGLAFVLNFYNGETGGGYKTYTLYYTRCVRGGM